MNLTTPLFLILSSVAALADQTSEVIPDELFGPAPARQSRTAADFINPVAFTTIPGIPARSKDVHHWTNIPGIPAGQEEAVGRIVNTNPEFAPDPTWSGARPDGHAPIGVMGEHTHHAGEFMASYRYMFMRMEQNYDGSDSVADHSFAGPPPAPFRVAPTDMEMEMHMFGLMYAPTDRLTLVGMLNLVDLTMNHQNLANGVTFKTESSGLGDSSVGALYRFWDGPGQRAHLGLGLLLPTAEVDEQDLIPGPGNTRLPYPMQLGAGSWGLAPSLTYLGQNEDWSWGGQINGKFYLAENDAAYRLGNRGEATVWGARRLNDWIGVSMRATGSTWGNITGSDSDLLPLPVPTVDPKRRGGSRLDGSLGLNLRVPNTGARLAVEAGVPLWQDLDGPQLATEWWLIFGAQYAF